MPRLTDPDALAAIGASSFGLLIFGVFEFFDGTDYLWSGPLNAPILWDGQTWIGTGQIAAIDRLAEDADLSEATTTVRLQLDGDLGDRLILPVNTNQRVTLSWVAVDTARGGLLPTPILRQVYTMGSLTMEFDRARDGTVDQIRRALILELAPETARLADVHVRRLTYQDGLQIDPNDHFLEFAADPDLARTGGTVMPVAGGPGVDPGETQIGPGRTDGRLVP